LNNFFRFCLLFALIKPCACIFDFCLIFLWSLQPFCEPQLNLRIRIRLAVHTIEISKPNSIPQTIQRIIRKPSKSTNESSSNRNNSRTGNNTQVEDQIERDQLEPPGNEMIWEFELTELELELG